MASKPNIGSKIELFLTDAPSTNSDGDCIINDDYAHALSMIGKIRSL